MAKTLLRKLAALDLEEKILNTGAFVAVIGVLFPWIGGEWLGGETVTYSGLSFYTGFMGITVLLLEVFVLLVTFIPLTGGPMLVRREHKHICRLLATAQSTVLILASLSVLTKTTLEFARMELRFGIYLALIGSLVALLYSFLRYQEQKRREVQHLFHHPQTGADAQDAPPPPGSEPPQPPPAAPGTPAPFPPEPPPPDDHTPHRPS